MVVNFNTTNPYGWTTRRRSTRAPFVRRGPGELPPHPYNNPVRVMLPGAGNAGVSRVGLSGMGLEIAPIDPGTPIRRFGSGGTPVGARPLPITPSPVVPPKSTPTPIVANTACPSGQYWNGAKCISLAVGPAPIVQPWPILGHEVCFPNYEFDPTTNVCVPVKQDPICPSGYTYDAATNSCVPNATSGGSGAGGGLPCYAGNVPAGSTCQENECTLPNGDVVNVNCGQSTYPYNNYPLSAGGSGTYLDSSGGASAPTAGCNLVQDPTTGEWYCSDGSMPPVSASCPQWIQDPATGEYVCSGAASASGSNWFTEDSIIGGLANWEVLGLGAAAYFLFFRKKR